MCSKPAHHRCASARAYHVCAIKPHNQLYLHTRVNQDTTVSKLVVVGLVEIIGRWLPTRWRSSSEVAGKWKMIESALEEHLTKMDSPKAVAHDEAHAHPRLLYVLRTQVVD